MVEMAEIFRRYGPQYRAKYGDRMLPSHRQVMRAIERCRTPALGGHVYYCEECGETEYQYHSCRNRHCPKCQNGRSQQWLEKQQDILLPVRYFPGHVHSAQRIQGGSPEPPKTRLRLALPYLGGSDAAPVHSSGGTTPPRTLPSLTGDGNDGINSQAAAGGFRRPYACLPTD